MVLRRTAVLHSHLLLLDPSAPHVAEVQHGVEAAYRCRVIDVDTVLGRAAERQLETIEPESLEAGTIKREIDLFRSAYQQLFASARDTSSP